MKKLLIIIPLLLSVVMATAQIECCDGSTSVLDAGAGFTAYSWSSGGSGQTENVTAAGTYTVTVTDGNGCTATATETVSFCAPLTAATSSTDNTSCDMNSFDGTATVTASGGCSGGYTYNWSTTPAQTTATATGLQGGTYSVTITSMSTSGQDCDFVASVTVIDNVTPPTTSITGSCN